MCLQCWRLKSISSVFFTVANDQILKLSANSEKEKSAWLESLASGPDSPLITSPLSDSTPDKLPSKEPTSPAVSSKENTTPTEVSKKSEHVPVKLVQVKITYYLRVISYR